MDRDIRLNVSYIYKIHLFIISTDKLSKAVKTLELPEYTYNGQTFKVELDVLDIEAIYKSKLAGFAKEDIIINCSDFGVEGIPCIKADLETEQYESYLAIVPGTFLAEIYKKHKSYFFPFTFAFICDTTTQTQGNNFGEIKSPNTVGILSSLPFVPRVQGCKNIKNFNKCSVAVFNGCVFWLQQP